MAWTKAGRKLFTCISTDTKPTTDTTVAEGIPEGAILIERNASTNVLLGYTFVAGAWSTGTTLTAADVVKLGL